MRPHLSDVPSPARKHLKGLYPVLREFFLPILLSLEHYPKTELESPVHNISSRYARMTVLPHVLSQKLGMLFPSVKKDTPFPSRHLFKHHPRSFRHCPVAVSLSLRGNPGTKPHPVVRRVVLWYSCVPVEFRILTNAHQAFIPFGHVMAPSLRRGPLPAWQPLKSTLLLRGHLSPFVFVALISDPLPELQSVLRHVISRNARMTVTLFIQYEQAEP